MAGLQFLQLHPFVQRETEDKVLGAIVGSALGDTIGLYTEFLPKEECAKAYPSGKFSLTQPTPLREDSHRDRFDPREWTDDTDHALLILLSYLHNKDENLLEQFVPRLRSWISQGLRCLDRLPLGLGNTVAGVTIDKDFLTSPRKVATESWKKVDRKPAANGSLMRTHPLGVISIPLTLENTFLLAARMSTVTHADPRCVISCCICTALLRGILRGEVLEESHIDEMCDKALAWFLAEPEFNNPGSEETFTEEDAKKLLHLEEFEKYTKAKTAEDLELEDKRTMGYVYKCLGAALFYLRRGMRRSIHEPMFEDLITEITMEGGDADTNACAAGALLGAWVGYSRLPQDWLDGLKHGRWLLDKSVKLCVQVGVSMPVKGAPPISADRDTLPDGGRGELTREQMEGRERDMVIRIMERKKERDEREKKKNQKGLGKLFNF